MACFLVPGAETTVIAVTSRVKGLFNQAAHSLTRAASTIGLFISHNFQFVLHFQFIVLIC